MPVMMNLPSVKDAVILFRIVIASAHTVASEINVNAHYLMQQLGDNFVTKTCRLQNFVLEPKSILLEES